MTINNIDPHLFPALLTQAYHFQGFFSFKADLHFIGIAKDTEKTSYIITDGRHTLGQFGLVEFKGKQRKRGTVRQSSYMLE